MKYKHRNKQKNVTDCYFSCPKLTRMQQIKIQKKN